ncbi:Shedu anti-phage system protein SduA domain-containing protein [Flavobacterium beibuense]|uniref:Shedu anti-phage system protein SduA domain-containing protein n=1 Tax=Flavobacterium beibuense TaxID=657326 RepID=UPI003A8D4061
MKVIYITNKIIGKQEALSWFQFYCDKPEDILIFDSIYMAKQSIQNIIIANQKHIDFIVTDWQFAEETSRSFLLWLRELEEIYSDENFIIRSLPVLLIEDVNKQSKYISEGFDEVIVDFPANKLKLRAAVKNAIKKWRYSLAHDLELIGLDPKTQKIYYNDRKAFISYHRLKVVSRKFVDTKVKKLNYIWNINDLQSLTDSNGLFLDKMNRTMKNPPRYLEKEFHDFFINHPTFIKGEDYKYNISDMLYEKHLYKNGTLKYDEPDFINKPYGYSLEYPEIFEIKRQSHRLITYKGDRFLARAKKSFEQVKRYKSYMTSDNPQNQYYIKKYLGQLYDSYNFTLLMGSLNEKREHEDLISRLKSDFDFDDINLMTYEELLDRHIRLCDRLQEFNIFD